VATGIPWEKRIKWCAILSPYSQRMSADISPVGKETSQTMQGEVSIDA
jgi:hypothetical protein